MKPPEKKEFSLNHALACYCEKCKEDEIYNQAIDDMHKWIDKAPIDIIVTFFECPKQEELVKALRKMLKGEQ